MCIRDSTHDATWHQAACEPLRGFGSSPIAPTRRSRQGGAPHRTNDLDGDKRRRTLGGAETALLTTEGSRNDACRPPARIAVCECVGSGTTLSPARMYR